MATYKTEGVVLKRVDYSEADRILTIFSKNKGKITTIAKGVRKMESRKGGNVELFNQTAFLMAEGRNMDIVTEAEVINSFSHLRTDLKIVSYTYQLIELVDQFTEDFQENYQLYKTLLEVLGRINEEKNLSKVRLYLHSFEVRLLGLVGFRPQLIGCVQCRRTLLPENNFFSASLGGIVCQECVNIDPDSRPISTGAIKTLRFLQEEPWERIAKLKISPELDLELEQQLKDYLEFHLEKELKSAKFIEKVKSTEG